MAITFDERFTQSSLPIAHQAAKDQSTLLDRPIGKILFWTAFVMFALAMIGLRVLIFVPGLRVH